MALRPWQANFPRKAFPEKTPPKHATSRQKNRSVFLSIRGAGYLTSQLECATRRRLGSQIERNLLPKWQARSGENCLNELAQPVFVQRADYATRCAA